MSSQLLTEISEQPATLENLLDRGAAACDEAAARIRAFQPAWINIAARGTSDNAARYAQYLFGAMNGIAVALAVPSLYTLYRSAPDLRRALTVGISQSGQSPDVVAVVAEAKRQGGLTLCITNDPSSPLAAVSDVCVPLLTVERAVAATKTYTGELLALAMISVALEDDSFRRDELGAIPGAVDQAIDASARLPEVALRYAEESRFVVLGRGFNYCTAFEIALKMKETSYVLAEPYSVADFLHGPVAMVDRELPALLVAPAGRAAGSVADLMAVLEKRRARVIAVSDNRELLARADAGVRLPHGIAEWLSPIVCVVPGQIWAAALASAKGLDPDSPRGRAKVTKTK